MFFDIFTPGVLICLGLLVVAIAGLIIYFENKFREHDHKIVSMLDVVTSLAEDVNDMSRHQQRANPVQNIFQTSKILPPFLSKSCSHSFGIYFEPIQCKIYSKRVGA